MAIIGFIVVLLAALFFIMMTGVVGVYSSREIAELAYETFWNGANNTAYESNITEVFLDREII